MKRKTGAEALVPGARAIVVWRFKMGRDSPPLAEAFADDKP